MQTIHKGSRGTAVQHAQNLLRGQGYPVDVDGVFGPGTEAAVTQFQIGRGLTADGIVGPTTWGALESDTKSWEDEVKENPELNDQQKWAIEQIPLGISVDRRRVLNAAISDLGADEVPDGSNWGPQIIHLVKGYNEFWKTGDSTHYPWCAMACSVWIGIGLGLGSGSLKMDWAKHPFGAFFGGAAQIEDWGKKNDRFKVADGIAPPGAVFTMARGGSGSDASRSSRAGHVGLVICDNGNGTFTTIEGNVSNGVRCKIRKHSEVNGFVLWWA